MQNKQKSLLDGKCLTGQAKKFNLRMAGMMVLVLIGVGVLGFEGSAKAQVWQETLEANFDHVSTFDELQDWRAIRNSIGDEDPSYQPKKLDGSASNWASFIMSDDAANKDDHIGDHGANYNWHSNKSLTINPGTLFCDVDDEPLKGYGPDSIYYYFGNGSAESGYTDVYIFYMMKFYLNWFIEEGGLYRYGAVYKGFMANQGSTGGYSWDETGCHGSAQAYHASFIIYNYQRYSETQLLFREGISRATDHNLLDPPEDCFSYERWQDGLYLNAIDMTNSYENHEWFGIEIHYILGSRNGLDGYVGIKMYDERGALIGSHDSFNVMTNGERETTKINRMHFGGNYQCMANSIQGMVTETRISYDDLIIDDQPIATSYFSLLNETLIPLNITTSSLPNATTNSSYSQTLQAQEGTSPYTWLITSGSLPTNLSLNNSTGIISGTPTIAGTSNFTIQATDSVSDTDIQALSITIENEPAPDTESPTTPTNLTATAISANRIDLTWTTSTDNTGVTGYNIQRCTGSSCAPATNIDTSTTNSYSDTSLNSETTYTYTVSAYDAVLNTSNQSSQAQATTQSSSAGGEININFQPSNADIPSGYLVDSGSSFADRGNGYSYGWNANNGNIRDRNSTNSFDQRYDTLNHMQLGSDYTWEIALDNGDYNVRIVAGDATYYSGNNYRINAENTLVVNGIPTTSNRWVEGTETITVSDGRLTISNADGSIQNRICFIEITSAGSSSGYGISNFIQLLSDWLQSITSPFSVVNLNNDGIVNTRDLGIMMSNWEE